MTKPWISDGEQRRSKKYQQLHAQLVREVMEAAQYREPSRWDRHREQSRQVRQQGAP